MRRGATIATAGFVVLAVGGCQGGGSNEGSSDTARSGTSASSSPSPGALDDGIMRRADAACRPDAKWIASHANAAPVPGFDYQDPDPTLLPKVATYLQKAPIYHGLADTLAGLDPPTQGTKVWRRLLGDVHRFETISQRQIDDARHADAAGWTRELAHKQPVLNALDRDVEAAGFTLDDPCWVVLHS
jgi:hypothetical protein